MHYSLGGEHYNSCLILQPGGQICEEQEAVRQVRMLGLQVGVGGGENILEPQVGGSAQYRPWNGSASWAPEGSTFFFSVHGLGDVKGLATATILGPAPASFPAPSNYISPRGSNAFLDYAPSSLASS